MYLLEEWKTNGKKGFHLLWRTRTNVRIFGEEALSYLLSPLSGQVSTFNPSDEVQHLEKKKNPDFRSLWFALEWFRPHWVQRGNCPFIGISYCSYVKPRVKMCVSANFLEDRDSFHPHSNITANPSWPEIRKVNNDLSSLIMTKSHWNAHHLAHIRLMYRMLKWFCVSF